MVDVKNILVTRPSEDANLLAAQLKHQGYNVVITPLIEVEFLENNFTKLQEYKENYIFIASSANAIRAMVAANKIEKLNISQNIKIIAIGNKTAQIASDNGFVNVDCVLSDRKINNPNIENLEKYITKNCSKTDKFVYISANVVAGNLVANLRNKGFLIEQLMLYKTNIIINKHFKNALNNANNNIDLVLIYSLKTAKAFIENIKNIDFDKSSKKLKILTLSQKITKFLQANGFNNVYNVQSAAETEIISEIKNIQ